LKNGLRYNNIKNLKSLRSFHQANSAATLSQEDFGVILLLLLIPLLRLPHTNPLLMPLPPPTLPPLPTLPLLISGPLPSLHHRASTRSTRSIRIRQCKCIILPFFFIPLYFFICSLPFIFPSFKLYPFHFLFLSQYKL
jgi:hypothetical protein